MEYLKQFADAEKSGKPLADSSDCASCFLCDAAAVETGTDEARDRLVLLRDQRGVILLNRYPYTNGHLLVCLGDHLAGLSDLSSEQRANMMELTTLGDTLLRTAVNAQGTNIGMNLGRCAGAGVPGHLHMHIVPRWAGDTNFMQAVGGVRVIPEALEESYEHLSATFKKMV